MNFRVDFGRIFPGVLMVIAGLIILVALLLVAVVAFFFSFLSGWGSVLGSALELTLVPAFLIIGGIVTILTGVTWWGKREEGWLSRTAKARAMEDRMRISARAGEVFGVFVSVIVFLFLYENQLRGVAFFTPEFGGTAQFLFYAPLFTGMALSLARALYGHRNGVRPLDSLNALFLAVSAFWLLSIFPFDFTHLGDMFPTSIQFMFGWLDNAIGRILFTLAGLGSLLSFVYTAFLYSSVRGQLAVIQRKDLSSDPASMKGI